MTDYVLEQQAKITSSNEKPYDFYLNVTKYANFLKQPLTLSMFIPTDSEGNVLEEPVIDTEYLSSFEPYERDLYKEAQEKVLFKENKDMEDRFYMNGDVSFLCVEDIINCDFELTDSAVLNLFGEK